MENQIILTVKEATIYRNLIRGLDEVVGIYGESSITFGKMAYKMFADLTALQSSVNAAYVAIKTEDEESIKEARNHLDNAHYRSPTPIETANLAFDLERLFQLCEAIDWFARCRQNN